MAPLLSWFNSSGTPTAEEKVKWLSELTETVELRNERSKVFRIFKSKINSDQESNASGTDAVASKDLETASNEEKSTSTFERKKKKTFFSGFKKMSVASASTDKNGSMKRSFSTNDVPSQVNQVNPVISQTSTVIKENLRFRGLETWRSVFEVKGSSDSDFMESFMVRRFLSHAGLKLEKKLLYGTLEKMSMLLGLIEEQTRSVEEEHFASLMNNLNAYLLCIRFGVAKTKRRLRSNMKSEIQEDEEVRRRTSSAFSFKDEDSEEVESPLRRSIASRLNLVQTFSMSNDQLSKNKVLLKKATSTRKKARIRFLQQKALDGVFEHLVLIAVETKKRSGGEKLDAEKLGTWLVETAKTKLFKALDENKAMISQALKGFFSVNQLLFDPSLYGWFMSESVKQIVQNKWGDILQYLKLAVGTLLDFIRDDYVVTYLKKLDAENMLNRPWKVDVETKTLELDEEARKSRSELQNILENGYLHLEHFLCKTSYLSMKNLEKLIMK